MPNSRRNSSAVRIADDQSRDGVVCISDDQMNVIAERDADKAIAKLQSEFYRNVGENIVKKFFWLVGVAAVSIWMWLQQNGYLK